MPLHTWWTFVIATFFVSASPGPNMLHVMATSTRYGLRNTFFTMAGCMLAVLSITSASAAGVGELLEASPRIFDILRFLGAAYLIYIGIKTMLQPLQAMLDSEVTSDVASPKPLTHFRSGFMVGISNPKLLLFATAFFPQFIDKAGSELLQFSILLFTFFWIELGWYMTYALGGAHITHAMKQPRVQKLFNRITGGLFALFGVLLLVHQAI